MEAGHTLTGAVVLLAAGIAGAALVRLPRSPLRLPLYAFLLAGVTWGFGDWVAAGARDLTTKQIGVAIFYTGAIALPPLWWLVALRWSDEVGARLGLDSSRWRWMPFAWCGAMWIAMITNPWHGAFVTPVVGGRNLYQPLWFMMAVPNYALIVAAFAVEIAVAWRVRRPAVLRQTACLIAASSVTLGCTLLYVTGVVQTNLTAVMISVSMSLLLVGIAREALFRVLPDAISQITADHPHGILVVGNDGYVLLANARARDLLAPVAIGPERPILDALRSPLLRPSSELPTADAEWWRALGAPSGVLFQLHSPDGCDAGTRWLQLTSSPLGVDTGGWLLSVHDVTSRHAAERQAAQQRRIESAAALAGSVARDFQGAFEIVRVNAELLERILGDDPAQRHLARIFEATRAGSELAGELELYVGGSHPVHVTLDLARTVEESCNLIEPELDERVRMIRLLQDRLLPVEADSIQLRDCLFELLRNAVEATAEYGGRVRVSTGAERVDPRALEALVWGRDEPPGEFAWVKIEDEGGGMTREVEERAFEPFFSTHGKDRGSGLPGVLGIARAHGALLTFRNHPERGCTVTLYLRSSAPT